MNLQPQTRLERRMAQDLIADARRKREIEENTKRHLAPANIEEYRRADAVEFCSALRLANELRLTEYQQDWGYHSVQTPEIEKHNTLIEEIEATGEAHPLWWDWASLYPGVRQDVAHLMGRPCDEAWHAEFDRLHTLAHDTGVLYAPWMFRRFWPNSERWSQIERQASGRDVRAVGIHASAVSHIWDGPYRGTWIVIPGSASYGPESPRGSRLAIREERFAASVFPRP